MVPIELIGTRKSISVAALLDEGATITIVNSRIIDEIGGQIINSDSQIKGVGGTDSIIFSNKKVNLRIKGVNAMYSLNNVLIVNSLTLPIQCVHSELLNICESITGIRTIPYNAVADIIIGQDNCELILTRDFKEIVANKLFVSRTLLGWVIHGFYNGRNSEIINFVKEKPQTDKDNELKKMVKNYFDIDSIGIQNYFLINEDEKHALSILEETSRYVDNAWEVGLPWKKGLVEIPDSRPQALRRLNCLEKKLDRDPKYANLYYSEMNRLIEQGFAVKREKNLTGNRVWYLPHFGVQNTNKPDRIRFVFDAAAKSSKKSFNDLLLPGPDLLQSLLGVIMRFRQFAIAIKADMRDMFVKINIREEDKDAQRFLWRGENRNSEPDVYAMSSVLFGAKSSPCTALFIKNKNADLFSSRFPTAVKSLKNNTYMDDYLDSCVTSREASERIAQITEINAHANWEMHGWASTSQSIIRNSDVTKKTLIKSDLSTYGGEKVLGLKWLNTSDKLAFNVMSSKISKELYNGDKRPTKREFLSVIMSVFDPLGFLAPFTIQSRILLQRICSSGIERDEPLLDDDFITWKEWLRDLEQVNAEASCIKISQHISFGPELFNLEKEKNISKSSRILSLSPYIDENGILYTGSRTKRCFKDYIILDSKDIFTQLFIKHFHEKYYHASHETVLNEIRQQYWIIGLRLTLRKIVSQCIICKLLRGKPANPKMGDLPSARMAYRLRPFSHCGLDYFGPLTIKIGRRNEKLWIALFTCMTTRAVHLELCHSLSTDSAIQTLKRFSSRRGVPLVIYSDNGTNFRGMHKELAKSIKEINLEKTNEFTNNMQIQWKFNPPTAAHMGGAWERLVRSIKTALYVVMNGQTLKEETLSTILIEIEHCVNSRLLTHVPCHYRDEEALTPNHFLLGASSGEVRIGKCDAAMLCTRKNYAIAQYYADHFWRRWLREYFPTLVPRKKWHVNEVPIQINDMVLILDENLPRNQWRKGVIIRVMPGSDGQVRVAEVHTSHGNFLRPARKLIKFA